VGEQGADPDGVGLSHAGGRVDETAVAPGVGSPGLSLEVEGRPAAGSEPGVGACFKGGGVGVDHGAWRQVDKEAEAGGTGRGAGSLSLAIAIAGAAR